jgi:hypothetical protein
MLDSIGTVPRKVISSPWKPWFAWRPVKTVSGKKIWFEVIYRRCINTYVDMDNWTRYEYGTLFDILTSE